VATPTATQLPAKQDWDGDGTTSNEEGEASGDEEGKASGGEVGATIIAPDDTQDISNNEPPCDHHPIRAELDGQHEHQHTNSRGPDETSLAAAPFREQLMKAQQDNPYLGLIVRYLESKDLPGEEKLARQVVLKGGQMELDEGLLVRHWWQQRDD
jgi:hypothetical protein